MHTIKKELNCAIKAWFPKSAHTVSPSNQKPRTNYAAIGKYVDICKLGLKQKVSRSSRAIKAPLSN